WNGAVHQHRDRTPPHVVPRTRSRLPLRLLLVIGRRAAHGPRSVVIGRALVVETRLMTGSGPSWGLPRPSIQRGVLLLTAHYASARFTAVRRAARYVVMENRPRFRKSVCTRLLAVAVTACRYVSVTFLDPLIIHSAAFLDKVIRHQR